MYSATAMVIENEDMALHLENKENTTQLAINLTTALISKEYLIRDIKTNDEDLENFLFTLGCFKGESLTVISVLAENYVIAVKDARYSIDADLAEAIIV